MNPQPATLLFDGVCSLCNGVVDFVIAHERAGSSVQFAALQSTSAKGLLDPLVGETKSRELRAERPDGGSDDPGTVVLVVGDHVYERSTAALHLASRLRWPWRLVQVGWVLPRFVRDAMYGYVARHRYAWFGKKEACRIPTPDERARFLG